jgi:hypothetical protein
VSTVGDLITWALNEVELKAYLGIADTSEDTRLELWLDSATERADLYIDRDDFESPIQVDLKVGVYEFVKAMRSYYLRKAGLKKAKTGMLEEEYLDKAGGGDAFEIARPHWAPLKLDRSLGGPW